MNASRLKTIVRAAYNNGKSDIFKEILLNGTTEREWVLTKALVSDDSELVYYIAEALDIKSVDQVGKAYKLGNAWHTFFPILIFDIKKKFNKLS